MHEQGRGLVLLYLFMIVYLHQGSSAFDIICKTCECTNDLVNCQNKALNYTFKDEDWIGLSPKIVNFQNNNISNLEQFAEITNLQELNLSYCNISSIDKSAFKYLQSMAVLDLSHNNLTSVVLRPEVFEGQFMPEEYEPLRSMRILRLSYNNLHSLHQDLFEHLPELQELYLRGNPMGVIDHVTVVAISSLSFLKVLDLSECQLKSLPEYFLHTPIHLERLDLSSNQLKIVPPPLEEAKSLKYLSLSNNSIKIVEQSSNFYTAFPLMPSLEELDMSHMPSLETINKGGLSGLESLKILRLCHNPALSYIDPEVMQRVDPVGESLDWPLVEELYISYNNLSTIDSNLLGRWDLLKVIDIRENPYLCDCTTQWIVDTLAPIIRHTSSNYTSDIICKEPIEMRGKSMIHLEEIHRHMRCIDKYGARPERDGAWLIATLIGILLLVPITLWILLAYKRGFFVACGMENHNSSYPRTFYTKTDTEEFM